MKNKIVSTYVEIKLMLLNKFDEHLKKKKIFANVSELVHFCCLHDNLQSLLKHVLIKTVNIDVYVYDLKKTEGNKRQKVWCIQKEQHTCLPSDFRIPSWTMPWGFDASFFPTS